MKVLVKTTAETKGNYKGKLNWSKLNNKFEFTSTLVHAPSIIVVAGRTEQKLNVKCNHQQHHVKSSTN